MRPCLLGEPEQETKEEHYDVLGETWTACQRGHWGIPEVDELKSDWEEGARSDAA